MRCVHYVRCEQDRWVAGAQPWNSERERRYPPLGFPMSRLIPEDLTPYITRSKRNIPDRTVALAEGARVIAADDSRLGTVELVFSEPITCRITHLLLSTGRVSRRRKLIPVTWVQRISEDEIQLGVNEDQIDALPDFRNKDD